jgi:transcriptional regulator with XRE-family HTH domain
MPKKEITHPGGKYVRALRKEKGLTQTVLGRALGYKKDNEIRAIELGEREPSVTDFRRFREVFNLTPHEWQTLLELYDLATEVAESHVGFVTTLGDETYTQVADLLCISKSKLYSAVGEAMDKRQRLHAVAPVAPPRGNLGRQALIRYYTPEKLARGNLVLYRFTIEGTEIKLSVATRSDWMSVCVPLDGDQEQCHLVVAPRPPYHIPLENVARLLASFERSATRLWDSPGYRMIDAKVDSHQLAVSFALDAFYGYRFTTGLVQDELAEVVAADNFNVEEVIAHAEVFLPLRQQILPDGAAAVDFRRRVCAGGAVTLLAIARPAPFNDFAIPVKRRSSIVADSPGMLSVIPKGFHEPSVDAWAERRPSFTVYRELFEELFGGDEIERDVQRLKHDWFFDTSEPLRWFREHRDAYDLELTSFGISLMSGNYELATLLVVRDEEFWTRYGYLIRTNWELEKGGLDGPFVSSKEAQQLSRFIQRSEWDDPSLFSFVEGLQRLRHIAPDRVQLPDIR